MIRDHLDRMAGKRIAGGCPDCLAYQVLEQDAFGIYLLRIMHDDSCPFFRAKKNGH